MPVADRTRASGATGPGAKAESRAIACCGPRLSDIADAAQEHLCEFCELLGSAKLAEGARQLAHRFPIKRDTLYRIPGTLS